MTTNSKSIVFIVDDDPDMRKLSQLVMESAGLHAVAYASGEDFLNNYQPDQTGCLVLDLRMPGMGGMEIIERLRAEDKKIPVIMLTGNGDVPTAVDAMKHGIRDFLEKPVDHRALLEKVHAALEWDAQHHQKETQTKAGQQRFTALTPRERQLLEMLISGKSNKQIARDLDISIKTVANHRASLMEKTGAVNAADLVRISMIAGI